MQCPDCKGTGNYVGFASVETCKGCNGSGKYQPAALEPSLDRYILTLCTSERNAYNRLPGNWYACKVGEPAYPLMVGTHVEVRYESVRMLARDLRDLDKVVNVYADEDSARYSQLADLSLSKLPVIVGPELKLVTLSGENTVYWHAGTKSARDACAPPPPNMTIWQWPGYNFVFSARQFSTSRHTWWAPFIERLP